MKTYILPISVNYVAHWGLWQAIREILQNAYDQRTRDSECKVVVDWQSNVQDDKGCLTIGTSTGMLAKSTLVLGVTDKADDPAMRGQFGEGYKLALLVLCRLGHRVAIWNDREIWTPVIKFDEQFESEVLMVEVRDNLDDEHKGVKFLIDGINQGDWDDLQENLYPEENSDTVLETPSEEGRIYVGGLFVAKAEGYRFGYAFKPGTVKLDRDRGMVEGFDLGYQASKLWREKNDRVAVIEQLMEEQAPDVCYLEHHVRDDMAGLLLKRFEETHGKDVVPVVTQGEIEEATAAGRKWAVVPAGLKKILAKVKSFFLPKVGSPVERIKKLVTTMYVSEEVKAELLDIVRVLENR